MILSIKVDIVAVTHVEEELSIKVDIVVMILAEEELEVFICIMQSDPIMKCSLL